MITKKQSDLWGLFNGKNALRPASAEEAEEALKALEYFEQELVKRTSEALRSGAVPEDTPAGMLVRVMIAIVAEDSFRPRIGAKQSRELYNNLIHF